MSFFCQIILFPKILEINNWNLVGHLYWLTRLEQEERIWSVKFFAGILDRVWFIKSKQGQCPHRILDQDHQHHRVQYPQ